MQRLVDLAVQAELCRDFYVIYGSAGFRNRLADFTHGIEVRSQGLLKAATRVCLGVANGSTSGDIRRVRGVARACLFDDDGITSGAHFKPPIRVFRANELPHALSLAWG